MHAASSPLRRVRTHHPTRVAAQPGLFTEAALRPIRNQLNGLLATTEAAQRLPWRRDRTLAHAPAFEGQCGFLPEDETLKARVFAERDRLCAIEAAHQAG